MYTCKSCGGNLRFDVYSQQLVCDYCKQAYLVQDVEKEQDAEQDEYDVMVYHCPQCGGEVYSMDTTVAGFCSYCGASTILQSRLEKENKIQYIIPFKKTKEDCKNAYMKLALRAFFAPKELKDKKYIEEFRGIYMPYWIYKTVQEGNVHFPGGQSHRNGDFIETDHYDLQMDIEMKYSGLNYDGAAAFADDISSRLAPFELEEKRDFSPGYLCGFYADMSDVDEAVYMSDAARFATNSSFEFIDKKSEAAKYDLVSNEVKKNLPIRFEDISSAMFPVWFLAYRNKDRVAYAAVNGQTGKVVADMPVDIGRYLAGTAILSIPLIFLLNMFFTILPSVLLIITSWLALFVSVIHKSEMTKIARKEGKFYDKGKKYNRKQGLMERLQKQEIMYETDFEEFETEEERKMEEEREMEEVATSKGNIFFYIVFFIYMCIVFVVMVMKLHPVIMVSIPMVLTIIFGRNSCQKARSVKSKKQKFGGMFPVAAVAIAWIIEFLNPVENNWYYLGAAASMAAVGICLIDLIYGYNLLATRRLTQFDHKGGDDRV